MEPRPRPPSYTLEVFADPSCVKAVVKAILHTIFFHRYFIPVTPSSHDLLSLSLPMVQDNDLETLIDQRATTLVRAVEAIPASGSSSPRVGVVGLAAAPGGGVGGAGAATGAGRAQIGVSFFETKKRKKTYFFSKADEEVCWETWTLDVTCATPRTESEAVKVRKAMEKSLQKTAMKIVNIVNRDKDHIPPITSTETNPFPYTITVGPKSDTLGMGHTLKSLEYR